MFENIIGQEAAARLHRDLEAGILAPSMLFFGPIASGKGTSALELGRVLSCEQDGAWNCPCPACARHRLLLHPDLLMMGQRAFAGEIAAAAAVLSREPRHGRLLLLRSARKLMGRFSPVLWEEDTHLGKLNPLVQALDDDLESLEAAGNEDAGGDLEKIGASIMKSALKLEAEGIGDLIPVAQIRRASYWGRLAPAGRQKLLLIENADRMREDALNSLLKILEEPPARLNIVLCTSRRDAILPTLLSRLRPYRFMQRDAQAEGEVIRRVFRHPQPSSQPADVEGSVPSGGLGAYLDSFLPVSRDTLYPLAAFFVSSVALSALDKFRRRGIAALPGELVSLGTHGAPLADAAGLGSPLGDTGGIIAKVLERAENFQLRSLFSRFLGAVLDVVSESLRSGEKNSPGISPYRVAYNGLWKKYVGEANAAVGTWNQSPALALDRLISDLTGAMAERSAE
jgi:DNA polymerase-3 subunit gamma/tau